MTQFQTDVIQLLALSDKVNEAGKKLASEKPNGRSLRTFNEASSIYEKAANTFRDAYGIEKPKPSVQHGLY